VEVTEQKKTEADLAALAMLVAALGGVDMMEDGGCCWFLFPSSLLLSVSSSVSDCGGVVVNGGLG
jgi:hypothetical protein